MKKKFFQILLMGAVTVSLGMFVSCKDTYSDLYKQLELKIEGNTSIEEVARMQKEQMEQMKKYVQDQLALIKQCNCPENMSETIIDCGIFICPTNVGGGIKLRVMDGLKLGMPIITHKVSARGYDAFWDKPWFQVYEDKDSFMKALEKINVVIRENDGLRDEIIESYKQIFSFSNGNS